ncbi:Holliday junction resolvase RecU [Jeotgalibaca sp. MA1X17-3]|uniref:Holliday junction resolvase RecU n=1 Tax=Jeotgalibaca sp. MA1X17-3 TaxID=2908211 RepID=UPI001F2152D0|nr:Holliday junction resolvase RecU [Jeotgalibaca sp. MA1X17-3]UJF15085.1 Holliday junction resolvase RecU [Jeotgalibaca sp. MA1X17-3]
MKPNKKVSNAQSGRTSARSGSSFEKEIEQTNLFYIRQGVAAVIKIPTGTRMAGKVNGVPVWEPSHKTGCDFMGVHRGKGIAFEAKSTQNKTSFPLSIYKKDMVKPHQVRFLNEFQEALGESFILIRFRVLDRTFKLNIKTYLALTKKAKEANKTSLPLKWIESAAVEVERKGYTLDYLNEKNT